TSVRSGSITPSITTDHENHPQKFVFHRESNGLISLQIYIPARHLATYTGTGVQATRRNRTGWQYVNSGGSEMFQADGMRNLLYTRKPGHMLPRDFYVDSDVYEADLDSIFHREWIFAGHTFELERPGSYMTLQI